jgi:hypothetical protein
VKEISQVKLEIDPRFKDENSPCFKFEYYKNKNKIYCIYINNSWFLHSADIVNVKGIIYYKSFN